MTRLKKALSVVAAASLMASALLIAPPFGSAADITGEDGKLLATGEFTFFCVDKSLMDQKVAAEQK